MLQSVRHKRSAPGEGEMPPSASKGARLQCYYQEGATAGPRDVNTGPQPHPALPLRFPTNNAQRTESDGRSNDIIQVNSVLSRRRSASPPSDTASSTSSSASSSDMPYTLFAYEAELADRGSSFMDDSAAGISHASALLCSTVLESAQTYPENSLFRDDLFAATCQAIHGRNGAMVARDITPLLVPSAQTLALFGATHLDDLSETVDEVWTRTAPVCGPSPQPSYAVGFARSAFSPGQIEKLKPFIGDLLDTSALSDFTATGRMYFPFLTCEARRSGGDLGVADRQNAHSMTVALRGVVELFRLVGREQELQREIVGFSVSHDNRTVWIYGHYPVFDGGETAFYRHLIHAFDITALEGQEKWTAYRFTRNVYDIWMPRHRQRICSAIDELEVRWSRTPRQGLEEFWAGQAADSG